jgi:ATP-dependent helicase HrpA
VTDSASRTRSSAAPAAAPRAPRPPQRGRAAPATAGHAGAAHHLPESLPVSGRREEIAQALQTHQVVIVCGETGSGKTTQLPKIALALGRGLGAGGSGLIGHTQPRRIAASSVAKRIAEELNSPLGEVVGYKVRFNDRLQPGASVKLMTDGILLAETQTDPLLKAYDTIIIDEAHERSLNIDFLLGYLRQILPRRPDLKIIVTSATIDADRFAQHFASAKGPAPIILVSGRTFPVEQRYRPSRRARSSTSTTPSPTRWTSSGARAGRHPGLPARRARDPRGGRPPAQAPGAAHGPQPDLPLFARLSQAEQDRVFSPGNGRRIVLATNVAETSLTVPGIRYVIDSRPGARQALQLPQQGRAAADRAISQAAANQRAGRCGRVANGICIRLYDEKDFQGRPRFTDPEILRSSLAGVILRMKSLHLGAVEDFPSSSAAAPAIADGYQLLGELGAVDEANELTAIGQELSKLPLDPRVGRMILEARDRQSLTEVLIIASALSGRTCATGRWSSSRPPTRSTRSSTTRSRSSWLPQALAVDRGRPRPAWARGAGRPEDGQPQAQQPPAGGPAARELHPAPRARVARHPQPAAHRGGRARLAPEPEPGHLRADPHGHAGRPAGQRRLQVRRRGLVPGRARHQVLAPPGRPPVKKPGRWIVAAELVETTRLFGRGLAAIEPQWLEASAATCSRSSCWSRTGRRRPPRSSRWSAPRSTASSSTTSAGELRPGGPQGRARDLHPRGAGQRRVGQPPALHRPQPQADRPGGGAGAQVAPPGRAGGRRADPRLLRPAGAAEVVSGATFERWYREASRDNPKLLMLSREELMRHEAAGVTTSAFPHGAPGRGGLRGQLPAPAGRSADGVTVTVPLYALNQVSEERCEWLVPGMLEDKVMALLKSLHQRPRSRLVPLPEFVAEFCATAPFAQGAWWTCCSRPCASAPSWPSSATTSSSSSCRPTCS